MNSTWAHDAHIVFVDQPAGVGFGYSNKNYTNETTVRQDFYQFLLGFYEKHPEFKSTDLLLTGESYGGIYLPNIAYEIL